MRPETLLVHLLCFVDEFSEQPTPYDPDWVRQHMHPGDAYFDLLDAIEVNRLMVLKGEPVVVVPNVRLDAGDRWAQVAARHAYELALIKQDG